MKILKLPAYCEPERISSSHLSKDLEEAYIAAGFKTVIYCPTPTRGISPEEREQYKKIKYEEKRDGMITVHRFNMMREGRNPIVRAMRYVLVNLNQYRLGARSQDIDLIMASSTPPTQGVLCGLVKKRLSKKYGRPVPFIYNLQDVFPDSLVTAGLAKKGGLLWKIGRKIEDYTYRSADAIIVIGEDIKKNIMEKGVAEDKIHIIPNWIDTETTVPVPFEDNALAKELGIEAGKFRVVYAGNLGLMQGVDTLIDTATLMKDDDTVEFLIFGKGAAENQLKARAADLPNVQFYPMMPPERVPEVYSLGDCCAVMCKKGTGVSGVPSKTWTIMACGRPLLVSFDESELCEIVRTAQAGLCSAAEDAEAMRDNIKALQTATVAYGDNARAYAVANTDKKQSVAKYVALINRTVGER